MEFPETLYQLCDYGYALRGDAGAKGALDSVRVAFPPLRFDDECQRSAGWPEKTLQAMKKLGGRYPYAAACMK